MRSNPTTIRCFIWAAPQDVDSRHEDIIDGVIRYAHAALLCGLDDDDIADDLLERYGAMFDDVDVENHGTEMRIIFLPKGMAPSSSTMQ
jgi:hypothetical protein